MLRMKSDRFIYHFIYHDMVMKVTIEIEGYIKVELCLFGHDIKSK